MSLTTDELLKQESGTKQAQAPRQYTTEEAFGDELKALGPLPKTGWARAGEQLGELPAQLGKGVNTTIGSLVDLVSPDSPAAKFFKDNAQYWEKNQSAATQSLYAAADARVKEAAKNGFWDEFATAVREYGGEPALVQKLIAENIVSFLPGLGAGKAAQFGAKVGGLGKGASAGLGLGTAAATNSALNAGGARGESYEAHKLYFLNKGLSESEANEKALEESKKEAAIGAVTGLISGGTGLEKTFFGDAAKGGVKAGLKALGMEFGTENLEEVAPLISQNVSTEKPWLNNVASTMVQTSIGSGPSAALSGGLAMRGSNPDEQAAPLATPDATPDATVNPNAGAASEGNSATANATPTTPPSSVLNTQTVDDAINAAEDYADGLDENGQEISADSILDQIEQAEAAERERAKSAPPAMEGDFIPAEQNAGEQSRQQNPNAQTIDHEPIDPNFPETGNVGIAGNSGNGNFPAVTTPQNQGLMSPANDRAGNGGNSGNPISPDASINQLPAPVPFDTVTPQRRQAQLNTPLDVPDTTAPEGLKPREPDKNLVASLQNRNRNSKASIMQMNAIAENPNPKLLMASPTMENGAPVVSDLGNRGIATVLGKPDFIVTQDREIPFQYAVVEADQLAASNFANGQRNPDYAVNFDKLTAINNGRVAGIIGAHQRDKARTYVDAITAASNVHGISADAIRAMRQPVLVRLIDSSHVSGNIGDESNTSSTLGLSAVEQARTDAGRLNMSKLTFNEDGQADSASVGAFIAAMPDTERQSLAPDGEPTIAAINRILGAVIWQAYKHEELTRLAVQATDPEARNVINALAKAAPAMMRLDGSGEMDFRELLIEAVISIISGARKNPRVTAAMLADQQDITHSSDTVREIIAMFARNIRSSNRQAEHLIDAANFAADAAQHNAAGDMFGGQNVALDNLIGRLVKNGDDTTGQEDLGEQGRGGTNESNDAGQETVTSGTPGTGRDQELELQGQTNEEIIAAEQAARDREQEERQEQEAERKAKADADKAEFDRVSKERAGNANNFVFGESSKDAASLTGNLFTSNPGNKSAPAPSPAPEPAPAPAPSPQQLPPKAPKPKPAKKSGESAPVSKNTIVTDDAAAAARARMKKRFGQLNSGIDPEMMQDGITLAIYHIERGARTFSAYARAMVADLGDAVKPYLKSWYAAVSLDPRAEGFDGMDDLSDVKKADIETIIKENSNESDGDSDANLEPDSQDAETADGVGEKGVSDERGGNSEGTGPGISVTGTKSRGDSRGGIPGSETVADGEQSDNSIYTGETRSGTEGSTAGDQLDQSSGTDSFDGLSNEPDTTEAIKKAATGGTQVEEKQQEQKQADQEDHGFTLEEIRESLPVLLEGQQEDVFKAEKRFAKEDGYGMMFTNGTGTGKTFTGLGVIKRFVQRGLSEIMIVAPSDGIIAAWVKAGKLLDLNIVPLENTQDAGKGISITTYANFGANQKLASRKYSLIVHDEAHYLSMAQDGETTNSLNTLRAISLHPDGMYHRHKMVNAELLADIDTAQKQIKHLKERIAKAGSSEERKGLEATADKYTEHLDALMKQDNEELKKVQSEVMTSQGFARPRVLMLSATPFSYELNVDLAQGYLFEYSGSKSRDGAYNSGSDRDRFFLRHFGYRMRTNKLTKPDAKEVDSGLMQRQFNAYLKKTGVLSGRTLDVKADYDRRFVLTNSKIGRRIDDALQWFENELKAVGDNKERRNALYTVQKMVSMKFDYLSRRFLLEAIKSKEVIPHVRAHLALGRKVVVFHDYNKGGGFNPFDLPELSTSEPIFHELVKNKHNPSIAAANKVIEEYRRVFADLIADPIWKVDSAVNTFRKEFPDVLIFGGTEKDKNKKLANIAKFQDDASGPQVILVQEKAGKEGISLHDTTGKHQRVLFNLGQPSQPVTAIQQEGRIYRTGQVTDAIFRYVNTGSNWEKWAFAVIASKTSAAENLGMGEQARALRDAFIAAFENSDEYPAGMEGEGKGGKAEDRAYESALTEYDRAKTFFGATTKKNSRTKSAEGDDYYATPEPIGLKMVEWADVRAKDRVLEPSAGHGAIARWIPDNVSRMAIEPSMELRARLAMVFDSEHIRDHSFEELNKYHYFDAIVMNPPFGKMTGGKLAMEHVTKALNHLAENGRLVALLPDGPRVNKQLDVWFGDGEQSISDRFTRVADILMPGVTFNRAGTGVMTRIVVIEKHSSRKKDATPEQAGTFDFRHVTNINKLFDELEFLALPDRANTRENKAKQAFAATSETVPDEEMGIEAMPATKKLAERAGLEIVEAVPNLKTATKPVIGVLLDEEGLSALSMRGVNQTILNIDKAAVRVGDKWFVREKFLTGDPDTMPKELTLYLADRILERAGFEKVWHTGAFGRQIRGVVRKGISRNFALTIKPIAIEKDGGYFFEEKYLYGDKLFAPDTTTADGNTEQEADTDTAPAADTSSNNQNEIVEHTTQKGKILRGVVRTDLTLNEAKEIDKYTFKKNGGFFIREEHLHKFSKGEVKPGEGQTVEAATSAMLESLDAKEQAVIRAMLDSGSVKIIDADAAAEIVGHDVIYSDDGSSKPLAFYDPATKTTYFIASNIPADYKQWRGLVLHEIAVHARKLGKDEKEFQSILQQVDMMVKTGNRAAKDARASVPDDTPAGDVSEETLAYLVQNHPELGVVQKFFAWMRNAIRAIGAKYPTAAKLRLYQWAGTLNEKDLVYMAQRALFSGRQETGRGGIMFARADNPMSAEAGLMRRTTEPKNEGAEKEFKDPRESKKPVPDQGDFRLKMQGKNEGEDKAYDAGKPLGIWQSLFSRNQIVQMYKDSVIGKDLAEYKRLREQITADQNKLYEQADGLLGDLRLMPLDVREKFASIAHEATLYNVDPTKDEYEPSAAIEKMQAFVKAHPENRKIRIEVAAHIIASKKAYTRLHEQYLALPDTQYKKGISPKSLFVKLRQQYENQTKLLFKSFEDRINRSDLEQSVKDDAIEKSKAQLDDLLGRVYFPLYRHGDFILRATKISEPVSVEHFETQKELNQRVKELEAQGYTVTTDKRVVSPQNMRAARAMGQIRALVGKAATDAEEGGNLQDLALLLDEIDQTILRSMPDASYKKAFIHRKGTKGYSEDFIRAYASAMRRSSTHIANMRYSDQIFDTIDKMRKTIKNSAASSRKEALTEVVNGIERREVFIKEPTGKLASRAGQVAFMWMLGSVSNFIVNSTQTWIFTMPYLGSEYGYTKANLEFAKAYGKQMKSVRKAKSLRELAKIADMRVELEGVELDIFNRLHDAGKIDLTQTFDLIDAANEDSEKDAIRDIMRFGALPQHLSEVVNRQVSMLAAIRLEMARSGNPEKAYQAAKDAVDDTHFDYSKENRAEILSGDTKAVLFKFKQYAQNAMYLWGRTAMLAMSGSTSRDSHGNAVKKGTPSERTRARKMLAGMLGTQFLAAGLVGLPIFVDSMTVAAGVVGHKLGGEKGAILGVAGALIVMAAMAFGDDDGEDLETEIKKFLAMIAGKDAADVLAHGVTPRGIASRLNASDMIFRRPDASTTSGGHLERWMTAMLGPIVGGIGGEGVKAAFDVSRGDVAEGLQRLVPVKQLRDMAAAWKWVADDMRVLNTKGEVVTDVSAADVFWKGVGVNPGKVVRAREFLNAQRQLDQGLSERKRRIMVKITKNPDDDAKWGAAVEEYNRNAPPGYEITRQNIRQHLRDGFAEGMAPAEVTKNRARQSALDEELGVLNPDDE